MAAKKTTGRKTTPKRPAKAKAPPVVDSDGDDEDDEEEDEEEESESRFFATYDSRLLVPIPHEVHASLVSAKERLEEADLKRVEADSRHTETVFSGFSSNITFLQKQLDSAHAYGDRQREEAERQRARVTTAERELSELIRQSEDAKVERERLANELSRAELANERFAMELKQKTDMRIAELEAVKTAGAPVFAAAGKGLTMLLAAHGDKLIPGLMGGGQANGAPPAANGAPHYVPPAPVVPSADVRVSVEGTDAWKSAFLGVFGDLNKEALACIRAYVCSAVVPNAPPVPAMVKDHFIQFVMKDAGEAKVMALLSATAAAFIAPQEQQAQPN